MPKVFVNSAQGKAEFVVEIAKNEAERKKGLMYRNFLAADQGMLFIFDKPEVVNFWMKHTHIALDIIFIGADLRIAHIERHAEPCPETAENCPLYSSKLPIKYVLEIGADLVVNFREGDLVEVVGV